MRCLCFSEATEVQRRVCHETRMYPGCFSWNNVPSDRVLPSASCRTPVYLTLHKVLALTRVAGSTTPQRSGSETLAVPHWAIRGPVLLWGAAAVPFLCSSPLCRVSLESSTTSILLYVTVLRIAAFVSSGFFSGTGSRYSALNRLVDLLCITTSLSLTILRFIVQFVIALINLFMRFGIFLAVLLFLSFTLDHREYSFVNAEKVSTSETRISQKTVVPASTWHHCSFCSEATSNLSDSAIPSFEGRRFPLSNCSNDGRHHPMEMYRLPPAEETFSKSLPCLSTTVAMDRTYVHQQGGQKSQETYAQGWNYNQNCEGQQNWTRERSQSRTHTPKKGRKPKGAKTPRNNAQGDGKGAPMMPFPAAPGFGKGQRLPPPPMPWPGYAGMNQPMMMQPPMQPMPAPIPQHQPPPQMAQMMAPVAPTFSAPNSSSGVDEFRTDGVHRNGSSSTIRAPSRHEASDAEDVKKGGSSGYERSTQCCQTAWNCKSRSGGGHSSPYQPDCFMEELPHGGGQDVARLYSGCCGQAHHRDQGRGRRFCGGTGDHGPVCWQDQRRPCYAVCVPATDERAGRCNRGGGECGEAAAHGAFSSRRSSRGGRRFSRLQGIFQAAFCLARLSMTFSYDSLGLCRHWSTETPGFIMKWHNRALLREEFVSEWKSKANIDLHHLQRHHVSEVLHGYQVPAWRTDIEHQVNDFNHQLLQGLARTCPIKKREPKKPGIDSHIWDLRTQKLVARRGLREIARRRRRELLRFCLSSWKQPSSNLSLRFWQYDGWLMCLNVKTFGHFQRSARSLKKGLRQGKSRHLQQAFDQLHPEAPASAILHELKKVVGPTNMRAIKQQTLPMIQDYEGHIWQHSSAGLGNLDSLFPGDGGWPAHWCHPSAKSLDWPIWSPSKRPHFIWTLMTHPIPGWARDGLSTCAVLTKPQVQIVLMHLCAQNILPCLRGRPTANYSNCMPHGQESLLHKGGRLQPIWKQKGPRHLCSAYRSVLISSHVGKSLHRCIRLRTRLDHLRALLAVPADLEAKEGFRSLLEYIKREPSWDPDRAVGFALDCSFSTSLKHFYRVVRQLALGGPSWWSCNRCHRGTPSIRPRASCRICILTWMNLLRSRERANYNKFCAPYTQTLTFMWVFNQTPAGRPWAPGLATVSQTLSSRFFGLDCSKDWNRLCNKLASWMSSQKNGGAGWRLWKHPETAGEAL